MTERRREASISRPLILEMAGKMLSHFSVQELCVIPPQTIRDILSTINLRASQTGVRGSEGATTTSTIASAEERTGEGDSPAVGAPFEENSTIAENLDLYLDAAIEGQTMNIEDYIGLLKTALPLDRRENHDGLIKAICKLIKSSKLNESEKAFARLQLMH